MTQPTNPIRVGVVGLGRSGYGIHLQNFDRHPDQYRVVAVADPDSQRATETAAPYGCPAYPNIESLLADDNIELVVVASPNRYHAGHAQQALEAGKHTVCEKPFGLTVSDVDAMLAARDSATARLGRPVILSPFQNRRFELGFTAVRQVLNSGKLGRIIHIRMAYHGFSRRWDWQTLRRFGGGQLNNNAPHAVDQALEFFADAGVTNPDDIEVFADLRNTLSSGDAEDHVRLTLRAPSHPDAPTIDIEFTAACAYPQDQWLVMGTSGGLRGNGKEIQYKWLDWSTMLPRPVDACPTPDRSYNRESVTWQEETIPVTDAGGPGAPVAAGLADQFYDGLYATLRNGVPLGIAPEEIRKRIAILEKARTSGGIVSVTEE
jgi:scyllo-inositol 2-dehydrogenase (NADP+)